MADTLQITRTREKAGLTKAYEPSAGVALPGVSIVINNYNYAQFLTDAIDSALAQTHPDVEVIVVDDGSSDNSREVIQSYGDQITSILKVNEGQASAFNAGMKRIHREIVIFLDSDDRLEPGTAELVAERFSHKPDLCLVMYRLQVMDKDGRSTGEIKPEEYLPRRSGDLRQHFISFPFDMTRMATSGNAFAAWALRFVMPIPEADYPRVNADWYLNYTVPLFGTVQFLDDIGGFYRVHGQNNFEQSDQTLDLKLVRQVITDDRKTARHIADFAHKLHLIESPSDGNILSVSYMANRLISLKLDRKHHPIEDDHILKVLALGIRASFRRFDVSWPMRLIFAAWFVGAALGPRPVTRWLAVKLTFPETRLTLNSLLGRLHHA